jgi:hypothetical protein
MDKKVVTFVVKLKYSGASYIVKNYFTYGNIQDLKKYLRQKLSFECILGKELDQIHIFRQGEYQEIPNDSPVDASWDGKVFDLAGKLLSNYLGR